MNSSSRNVVLSVWPRARTSSAGKSWMLMPLTVTRMGVMKWKACWVPSGRKVRVSRMPFSSMWTMLWRAGATARSRSKATGPAPWSRARTTL